MMMVRSDKLRTAAAAAAVVLAAVAVSAVVGWETAFNGRSLDGLAMGAMTGAVSAFSSFSVGSVFVAMTQWPARAPAGVWGWGFFLGNLVASAMTLGAALGTGGYPPGNMPLLACSLLTQVAGAVWGVRFARSLGQMPQGRHSPGVWLFAASWGTGLASFFSLAVAMRNTPQGAVCLIGAVAFSVFCGVVLIPSAVRRAR